MKALVIGGGIGGVSAALALLRSGIDAHVFERAGEVREIGAGLSFWSNGLAALRPLGVEAEVEAAGAPIEVLENVDWRGRVLQRIPAGRIGRHVAIQRPDLLRPLAAALGADRIHAGRECVGVTVGDGVTACFADGSVERGDVLIGADGIFSTVRALVASDAVPAYAGHVAWRGIARFRAPVWPVGTATSVMGRARHFAVEPLADGRIFWYATQNLPEDTPSPGAGHLRDEVLAAVGDCFDPVPALIAATPEEAIFRTRVYDLPTLPTWTSGSVALLGDAAHATRPNLGQGACLAVEDAVVLAACLRGASDVPAALRNYEAKRRKRTGWVVRWSRWISELEYLESPLACAARDGYLRLLPGPLCLPWLRTIHAFDPPPRACSAALPEPSPVR